jgi:hypothetical protein
MQPVVIWNLVLIYSAESRIRVLFPGMPSSLPMYDMAMERKL